jgi:serine phosphatase RsbU (regulator of sigma subunit)
MANACAESNAFREAQLKSERLRIRIVLGVVGAAILLRVLRTLVVGGHENVSSSLMMCGLLAVFSAYEYFMLRAVNRAIQNGREYGNWVWLSNIILETCLPALAVAFLSSESIDPIYRPLANPAGLAFFLLISLSTLRLDPGLCRLSGLAAALSYLVASAYLGWRPVLSPGTSILSPQRAVFGYAFALVIAGFACGMVAGEIRKQVEAALREAEAQRQVDRLEHDLSVARSIQQSLLPNVTPEICGFEIAGWNRPADQTGGDYYDWQVLPNGTMVAELADVTGHGIGPALLAAVCRAYARVIFSRGDNLLDAMVQLNAELIGDIGEGRFVTFVAAVCVPGGTRVELLSAGHGPLFVYFLSEDRFEEIGAQGLPLGISSQFVSDPPKLLDLNKGDLLVLATDGFFEWTNGEGEQFGVKRAEETIRKSKEKRPSELISTLYAAVLAFSGGTKQQDDLTAVVIKRT